MSHCEDCKCEPCIRKKIKREGYEGTVRWVSIHRECNKVGRFVTIIRPVKRVFLLYKDTDIPFAEVDLKDIKNNFFPEIFKNWEHWQHHKEEYLKVSKLSSKRDKLKEYFGITKDYPLYDHGD